MARRVARISSLVWLGVFVLGGCESGRSKKTKWAGQVVDVSQSPIEGAKVSWVGEALQVTTDERGVFRFRSGHRAKTMVLRVSAAGYATAVRRIELSPEPPPAIWVVLQPVDVTRTVTISAAGPPAEIQVIHDDGEVDLTIPPGSLVIESGQPVSGEIEVQITYWNPETDAGAFPAALSAVNPDGSVPIGGVTQLFSVGMTAIDIAQDGNPLQVAAGSTLGLEMKIPINTASALADPELNMPAPRLYYLNEETGWWQEEGDSYSYDYVAGVLSAQLPHLSLWNGDVPMPDLGGCVCGTVKRCDPATASGEAPAVGALVKIRHIRNGYDGDSLLDYQSLTDEQGRYCVNLLEAGHSYIQLFNVRWPNDVDLDPYASDASAWPPEATQYIVSETCRSFDGECRPDRQEQYEVAPDGTTPFLYDNPSRGYDVASTCECFTVQDCASDMCKLDGPRYDRKDPGRVVDKGCNQHVLDGDQNYWGEDWAFDMFWDPEACRADCEALPDIQISNWVLGPGQRCGSDSPQPLGCCQEAYVCEDNVCVPAQ